MIRTLSALPTLMKVGFARAVAYRAETLIWVLSTTMPLVMLPLWHAVSEEAPVAGFAQTRFTTYFLAAFVVRQVVGAWASWTINYEVRTGALNQRLLRPIHPIWTYATDTLASIPVRAFIALPVALIAWLVADSEHVLHDPVQWFCVPLVFAGAWAIAFSAHLIVGALSLWMHQTIKLMDLWTALFFVFSGYLIPLPVFPSWLREVSLWMPFPYQLGFPVDVLTGALTREVFLSTLVVQWQWVAILSILAAWLWRRGLRRYGAFGG